jgi:hypothetical protein
LSRCVGRGLQPNELKSLTAVCASPAATTSRPGSATTLCMLALEVLRRRERVQNQEDDYRMHKKRGGDTLPPPLSSAWYADWRTIVRFYYVVSFGDMPITLTPAPREISIA